MRMGICDSRLLFGCGHVPESRGGSVVLDRCAGES